MRAMVLSLLAACSTARAAEVDVDVTGTGGLALENAVAWLTPKAGAALAPAAHATIDQHGRRFVPQVSIVQTGAQVEFPNSDNIRHSVYSFSTAKPFTLKLYSGRPAAPLTFDKPGIVLLGCNIHDTMVAWVAVVDSNWFGRTDATGRLKLHDVPDGVYQLHVWHPGQLGEFAARELKVTPATATQAVKLDATDIATLLKSAGSPAHPEGDS